MELALRIKQLTGSSSEIVLVPYDQAYGAGFDDMQRRVPDTRRARELLGWSPTWKLDDIVNEMAHACVESEEGHPSRPEVEADSRQHAYTVS
jgi:UDP-glucose 4-epimerase